VYVATSQAQVPDPVTYPFPDPPGPGEAREVGPGVLWLRMALPMAGLNPDVAAGWNMNLGWYNNIWIKQVNGEWCIKEFNAYTSNLNLFPVVSIGQSFSVSMN